ncbi:hypothetical protein HYFRA_00002424 [Hymenoscyphus fraxineus]|uniref:2EXR domain-containing protein n=1 Tax=Hymenoscyphus fraxineus TaxID=746836 RepID=A0A9N9LB58_9HELO|nr:hypothetical protein HYFRA_00002424 [Hymenoscyphus fraxineus]
MDLQRHEVLLPYSTRATSNNDSPPKEFHNFPNLPKEIRREIWQMALLVPRVLEFVHDRTKGWLILVPMERCEDKLTSGKDNGAIVSVHGNSSLLAVNSEARQEAKAVLTYFENGENDNDQQYHTTAVNCALDTLVLTFNYPSRSPHDRHVHFLYTITQNPENPQFPLPQGRKFRNVAVCASRWVYTLKGYLLEDHSWKVQVAFTLMGIQEVNIIVARRNSNTNTRDMTLEAPQQRPEEALGVKWIQIVLLGSSQGNSWKSLEILMAMHFKKLHKARLAELKLLLDSGSVTAHAIDTDPRYVHLRHCEDNWVCPVFKFRDLVGG